MALVTSLRKLVNVPLGRLGYRIQRVKPDAGSDFSAALTRLAARSLTFKTLIDVGASDGRWSRQAGHYFPDVFYFLIEANPVHEPGLQAYKTAHPRSDYILAVAGDTVGDVYFDGSNPFGGHASHSSDARHSARLPATTIDFQVQANRLQPPFAVKLDTHGFEVPILNGARQTLAQANLVIIETYNFDLEPDSLRFWEMAAFMQERGFRPIDISNLLWRPADRALWQFDLYFVRSDLLDFSTRYADPHGETDQS